MNSDAAYAWSGRWSLVALVAGAAYIAAYVNNFTPFYYFPMVGEWHWTPQPPALGPGITYYGWKATGLVAGLCSLTLPEWWTRHFSPTMLWVGALALSAVVIFHESHWFFK